MDAKEVGQLIAKLRSEKSMTQKDLGDYLNVSDKAVSRWERGDGYPEIEQFPKLAELFRITIIEWQKK